MLEKGLIFLFIILLQVTPSLAAPGGVKKHVAQPVKVQAGRGEPVDALILYDDTVGQEAENISLLNRTKGRAETVDDYNLRMQHRKARLNTLKAQIKSEFDSPDLEILRDYSVLPVMYVRIGSAQALDRLIQHGKILSIDENLRQQPSLAESLPLISQPTVWNDGNGYGGAGATIAVLDTGVDYTQAAFGSCLEPGDTCKVVYAQDIAPSDDSLDDHGHGTNVAGIALGVAPAAKIAALDVFSSDGYAYTVDTIAAIDWCVANKANYNINAINMSLGGSYSTFAVSPYDSYGQAIQHAVDANIVVVASSGNEAYINALSLPAAYNNVVSVGAVYDDELGSLFYNTCYDAITQTDKVACFSNSASFLTMLAPGMTITAAGIMMGGTSQASPHVAGAVAVLKAAFPNETVAQTIARLKNGQPIMDERNGIIKPRLDLISASGLDELENGKVLNYLSGTEDSYKYFYIDVPPNAINLTVQTFSGEGDEDLYVSREPTFNSIECSSLAYGNNETCTFNSPEEDRYYILLYGFEEYNGVSLHLSYEADQDSDGVLDSIDNCAAIYNPDQSDVSGNDIGDACDTGDYDADGLSDAEETLLGTHPDNSDTDGDGIPDGQDTDPLVALHFAAPTTTLLIATINGEALVDSNTLGEPWQAVAGDEIAVFDPAGVLCGRTQILADGEFGPLTVYGDDPVTTGVDEGAIEGETLTVVLWDGQRQIELPVRTMQLNGDHQTLVWNDGGGATVMLLGLTQDRIGVAKNGKWNLDDNDNGVWEPSDLEISYGAVTDTPIFGDWNGDGIVTPGIKRGDRYFLRNSNTTGVADITFQYGASTDVPIVGDWDGNGTDTIGIKRGDRFYLRNSNSSGVAEITFQYGAPTDIPVVGDWNGDGTDTIGIRRGDRYYLRNSNTTGAADIAFQYGTSTDIPIIGDWDGDGIDTIGIYRSSNGNFYLRNSLTTGVADIVYRFGLTNGTPMVGKW